MTDSVKWKGLDRVQMIENTFYQTAENEEDHEKASEGSFSADVAVTHGGHGDHK